jgi:hypothetical protein
MRLHTSEDRNPISPINFVKYSRIKWVHDAGCDDHTNPDDPPSESKLSGGGYTHWTAASDCSHQATTWTSKQYTAVGETYDSPRPGGLEGFTLNLDDDMRDGGAFNADEPVIVRTDNNWIQYWFNFGDSQNLSGSGHEGDWEHISIRLSDKNVPKEVEYSFHHDKCTLLWDDVPKFNGDRPIVWLALGSHGAYPPRAQTAVIGGHADLINEGSLWDGRTNLVRLSNYTWYGYEGGWGTDHAGYDDFGPSSPGTWRGAPAFDAPTCTFAA